MHMAIRDTDYDLLLTEVQAADYLKLSMRTLQAWRVKGTGPQFVRAGRAIRYRRQDLLVWIKNQTVRPTAGRI
jgi:Helix-turn-helix domain